MRKLSLIAYSFAFIATICTANAAEIALAPFYKNVAAISPDHPLGTVVAKEQVDTQVPNAEAWRIAYVSSDVRGQKTLATALVVVPKGEVPAGGRPIVAWAHGTTGTAQYCGPSQVLDPVQELNEYFLVGGTSWTDFGIPAVNHWIEKGYAVVATDYQGLGGGGRHQYAVANSNAHDAINSVRAAPLSVVSPFRYASMIWALLIGYGIWRQIPDGVSFIGIAAIAAAGLFTFYRERQLQRTRSSAGS